MNFKKCMAIGVVLLNAATAFAATKDSGWESTNLGIQYEVSWGGQPSYYVTRSLAIGFPATANITRTESTFRCSAGPKVQQYGLVATVSPTEVSASGDVHVDVAISVTEPTGKTKLLRGDGCVDEVPSIERFEITESVSVTPGTPKVLKHGDLTVKLSIASPLEEAASALPSGSPLQHHAQVAATKGATP